MFRPDPRSFELREEHHRATFSACELPPSTMLITIHGEIDATNSMALARYVERRVGASRKLILDLQTVEFFAASGFAALSNINVMCQRTGIRWTLQAGPHVRRLLRACDPTRELPVAFDRSATDTAATRFSHSGQVRTRPSDRKLLVGWDN